MSDSTVMQTRILDGKKIAEALKSEAAAEVRALKARGVTPGLVTVIVGNDPASEIYVGNKVRTSHELGMVSEKIQLAESAGTDQLLEVVDRLNQDDRVDGILVQSPLPGQIDEGRITEQILPEKDVDGFHPINVGKLVAGEDGLFPCTPMGIMEMLTREDIEIRGAEAVVIGRSNIVGKPMALLLLHRHATVTICHSRTRDLAAVARRADILVAAVGVPALVTREFIKPGAVVVDVGMNRLSERDEVERLFGEDSPKLEAFERRGSVLVGDVHPRDPYGLAAAITPVPGGVGPLTIAYLMKNTVKACRRRRAG